jgi:flagellar motor switch protein FliM
MALQVGETLLLPTAGLDKISLETIDGRHVASARLGQHRGMRALKICDEGAAQAPAPAPQSVPMQPAVSPLTDAAGPEFRAAG